MRKIKHVVGILLILTMAFSLSACQNNQNQPKAEESTSKKLENPEVSIFVWTEEAMAVQQPIDDLFREKYGGNINYTITRYQDRDNVVITRMAAGDSIDLFRLSVEDMPRYAIKGLVQPVDKYVDWNDPAWKDVLPIAERCKYKGSHYGVQTETKTGLYVLHYNKTMFENNGIPTPVEYHKQGKWNWRTFQDVCIKLTQDTDKDGAVDQWAYIQGYPNFFALSNNTDFVNIKDDGQIELNLDDPKLIDAIQFYQDATSKYKYTATKGAATLFPVGKLAMTVGGIDWAVLEHASIRGANFELGIAPFPQGPSSDKAVYPGRIDFWGIGNGAKNPEGAAAYLQILVEYYRKEEVKRANREALKKYYKDEELDVLDSISQSVILTKYQGLGSLNDLVKKMYNQVAKGKAVMTVLEEYKPQFQAEIDAVLQDSK